MPTFNVRLRGDASMDPPELFVGVDESRFDLRVMALIPFSSTTKEVYQHAETFGLWFNTRPDNIKQGLSCQVDKRLLYNQFRTIHFEEMRRQRVTEHLVEFHSQYLHEETARKRAKELLRQVNPDLLARVEQGGAFYVRGQQHVFIISPLHKQISVLLPDGPKSLCVYIENKEVNDNKYDWILHMWTRLQAQEDNVLKVANHFDFYNLFLPEGGNIGNGHVENGTQSAEPVLEGERPTGETAQEN